MQRLFVVCWGAACLLAAAEAADVRFVAISRYFNPKYITNFTTVIGTDPHGLNLDVTLIQPILKDFYASVDVQIKLKDSTRYQSLFTEDFDVCELVKNVFVDNLVKKWHKNLLKYGNFMEYCPVPEGHYFVRSMQVEQSSLALYLRPGDYRIVGRMYFKKPGMPTEIAVTGQVDVKWIN